MPEGRVSSSMRTDPLTLAPETPIREASARLLSAHATVAPVVDPSGRLLGILSEKDCFRPALSASYYRHWTGTVADHMSGTVETIDADTDLVTAAEAFLEHPFRSFPVTKGGLLVGLLDRSDLLAAFLRDG